jgi:TetR/AcrR family transcriptional regulator, cholesterol catabolism regulator
MGRPLKPRKGKGTEAPWEVSSERRQELMVVAGRVFAQKGVGNTTMRDIADEAGILSGSLYHHFRSKDTLLEGVLRRVLDDLTEHYEAVRDAGLDPQEAVEQLISVGLKFVVDEHDVTAIVQNDYTYLHDVDGFGFVEDISARHRRIWRQVLERGVDAGVFRDDIDLDVAYRSMMGSIVSVVRWYRTNQQFDVDQLAAAHTALYLNGLRDPRKRFDG